MATPRLPIELLQQAVDAVAEHGSVTEAAKHLKMNRGTFDSRYRSALSQNLTPGEGIEVPQEDRELYDVINTLKKENESLRAALSKSTRPKFTLRSDNHMHRSEKTRVIVIGDAHDSPAIPDQSRFKRIGQYVRKIKPDCVIQIGDLATLDSLSYHTPNASYDGKFKPTFEQDMSSLGRALELLDCGGAEKHITLGNHEQRLFKYEQNNPEVFGQLPFNLLRLLDRSQWTYSQFGQVHFIGGVGFVHVPLNRMGKPYGGKTAEQQIANDCLHDLVCGHSHVDRKHKASKIGNNREVQIINVGCALPEGYIEPYALHSSTGWSYGIADMTIQHGCVRDYNFVSMARLNELYK